MAQFWAQELRINGIIGLKPARAVAALASARQHQEKNGRPSWSARWRAKELTSDTLSRFSPSAGGRLPVRCGLGGFAIDCAHSQSPPPFSSARLATTHQRVVLAQPGSQAHAPPPAQQTAGGLLWLCSLRSPHLPALCAAGEAASRRATSSLQASRAPRGRRGRPVVVGLRATAAAEPPRAALLPPLRSPPALLTVWLGAVCTLHCSLLPALLTGLRGNLTTVWRRQGSSSAILRSRPSTSRRGDEPTRSAAAEQQSHNTPPPLRGRARSARQQPSSIWCVVSAAEEHLVRRVSSRGASGTLCQQPRSIWYVAGLALACARSSY